MRRLGEEEKAGKCQAQGRRRPGGPKVEEENAGVDKAGGL